MADAVVIHKSDGENLEMAKQAKRNYQNALHLFPAADSGWSVPVLTASSYTKTGLEDIWNVISNYEAITLESGFKAKNRAEQRVKWLEENLRDLLGNLFFKQPEVQNKLKTEKEKVAKGELSPMVLAKELIQIFIQNK